MMVTGGLSGVLLGHPEGETGGIFSESPIFAKYTVCLR
jgi:hypothetical protein